jgi:hypothetical protein
VTDIVPPIFEDWADQVEANPTLIETLVTAADLELDALQDVWREADAQVAEKLAERDQVRNQRLAAEFALEALTGDIYSIPMHIDAGSLTATGAFAGFEPVVGGWASAFGLRPGTIITGWTETTLTLSRPPTITGTVTATVKTGTLAVQDAEIIRTTVQVQDLQQELEDLGDLSAILATIADGRAALETAGHYLAPRTVLRSAPGFPLTTTSQTENLQDFLDSVPSGSAGDPNFAHLWSGFVYRSDFDLIASSKAYWQLWFEGSRISPGQVGLGNRVQLQVQNCTNVRIDSPKISGSGPTSGAPAFVATYAGQHGLQVTGGVNVTIDSPDIYNVYGSGIRFAPLSGTDPLGCIVQGTGQVQRCGNHGLAVAGADGLEWKQINIGATGRESIDIEPASGEVSQNLNIHDFVLTGAVTDGAYDSIHAYGVGRWTTLTLRGINASATHGPLLATLGTTAGTAAGPLVIDGNTGGGVLVNSDRAAFRVYKVAGLTYTGNTQAMAKVSSANVMYGLKGTTITGTIVVNANTITNKAGEALIDGVVYPATTPLTITGPSSVPNLTVGVDFTDIVFTAAGGIAPYTWTWAPHFLSSLPTNVTFTDTGNTGVLAGIPNTIDSHSVDITVTDAAGTAVTGQYAINVIAAGVYRITVNPNVTSLILARGQTMDNVVFDVVNSTGAPTWSISSGTLPPGVTWTTVGGVRALRGNPTTNQASSNVVFRAVDPDTDADTHTIAFTVQTAVANPLKGAMSLGMGDHSSNKVDFQAFMAHIKSRRQDLVGNQNHHLNAVRIDLQWTGWEGQTHGDYTASLGGKLTLIDEIVAEGMVPLLGAWFVPKWLQRRNIIGMPTMQGRIISSNTIRFDNPIPKGDYGGMSISGPGTGGFKLHRDGTIKVGEEDIQAGFLPNQFQNDPGDFIVQGGGMTPSSATVTFQVGGQNNTTDGRLPINPGQYEDAFESFRWLAQQLDHIPGLVMFELSNEGNHVPYSKPRSYPEMFCRAAMYQYAGIVVGSGNKWQNRVVIPAGCAARPDSAGGAFNYPDFTSGPSFLSPVNWYKRWLDEMVRLRPTWQAYRAAKNIDGSTGSTANTDDAVFCTDYGTHCYTEPYRKTSPLGENIDNVTKPGDVAFENFDKDPPGIHNAGWNLGTIDGVNYRSKLRNWLVHCTENGPGWGEVNDDNGIWTKVGVGFVGTRPDMAVGSASKKRNILHPHEAFVYVMRVNEAIGYTSNTDWVGDNWLCGEVMIGIWSLFRGFGTITDDPLHQTLASWFKWDPTKIESPPLPTRFRTKLQPVVVRGQITKTTGARTGPMDNYFTSKLGYSPVDALAVL